MMFLSFLGLMDQKKKTFYIARRIMYRVSNMSYLSIPTVYNTDKIYYIEE